MRRLSAKFRSRLRGIAVAGFFAALAVALAGFDAKSVHAAEAPQVVVKVGGKLPVPPTTPIGVIATDPCCNRS